MQSICGGDTAIAPRISSGAELVSDGFPSISPKSIPGLLGTRMVCNRIPIIKCLRECTSARLWENPVRAKMANSLTALVTGGTSGIGRAAASKLAQLGIHVIVVGRNAVRRQLRKSAQREARQILFRLTFKTRRAHGKWRDERSRSETAMSIF